MVVVVVSLVEVLHVAELSRSLVVIHIRGALCQTRKHSTNLSGLLTSAYVARGEFPDVTHKR